MGCSRPADAIGSTSDGYGDSWVQGQLGTVTDGYRCDSRVQGQSGTKVGDSRVQGQSGTSGATNGYSDKRVQVRHTGTATIGYKKCKKKVFFCSPLLVPTIHTPPTPRAIHNYIVI